MKNTDKLYFEDFPAGEAVDLDAEYTVTLENLVEFAEEFDPQPMHLEACEIPGTGMHGPIASGWHTCAISMRLMSDGYISNAEGMGSPGMDSLKWNKPVYPGDILRMRRTCRTARVSKSKPEMGICGFLWEILDQNDELVMEMTGLQMFRTRASLVEAN
jgi:acyl dehydratase